jgi:putative ATPase
VYRAYGAARTDIESTRNDPVPLHLRNAPTALMKDLGYGRGYRYAHDFAGGVVAQQNLPDNLVGRRYYEPTERGFEQTLGHRLAEIRALYDEARRESQESDQQGRND